MQLVDAKCVTCIHIRSLTAVQVYVEGKKFMSLLASQAVQQL